MAGQPVDRGEVEIEWDDIDDEVSVRHVSVTPNRDRAKETSGSSDPGLTTGKSVGAALEAQSVFQGAVQLDSSLRGAVYRDSPLLTLTWEDPDATLPYNPRSFYTLVPEELGAVEQQSAAPAVSLVSKSVVRGPDVSIVYQLPSRRPNIVQSLVDFRL